MSFLWQAYGSILDLWPQPFFSRPRIKQFLENTCSKLGEFKPYEQHVLKSNTLVEYLYELCNNSDIQKIHSWVGSDLYAHRAVVLFLINKKGEVQPLWIEGLNIVESTLDLV